ncbi:MAG: hypothetical protein BMS9Abin17_1234 [Acidimicrobiia bacterium]|nr:MAG: hypothetical protein BMS9Abin17_1234 [Acidimicrobiia bacterium]
MSDDRPPEQDPISPTDGGEVHKTIVRLVAGGVGEGVERLMSMSASLDEVDDDDVTQVTGPYSTNPTVMAVLGWISELPEQIATTSSSLDQVSYPLARLSRVIFDTTAALAEATGIAPFVSEVTAPTRRAIAEEIDRLTAVGSAEYARGRVLATETFMRSIDGIVGYLGDSDEVGELIREQTLGFAGSAVQEVRETGAAADGLTEGIFRRIFGREIQTMPPKPAFDTE